VAMAHMAKEGSCGFEDSGIVWSVICIFDAYIAYIYILWLFNMAMENGPFIDGLPIKNGDFPWLC